MKDSGSTRENAADRTWRWSLWHRPLIGYERSLPRVRNRKAGVELGTAIGQLVDEAVVADVVIDVYALAGIETPGLSVLSDEFLDGIAYRDRPNLQMGMLRKLLSDEIRTVQPPTWCRPGALRAARRRHQPLHLIGR